MSVQEYTRIDSLAEILLEESYVLGISIEPGVVTFAMEFVLTERHVEYRRPAPDESFCYICGTLTFTKVTDLTWSGQGSAPATDATGEEDYGHIDSLSFEGTRFSLEGDWGSMTVAALSVGVILDLGEDQP